MPTNPAALLERARTAWQRISRSQQIAMIVGVVVSVALVIGFLTWSQQTTYGVLFSNLQTQDASAIVAQLKTSKIPYQIASNGTAVMVPTNMVDETRLMLAGNGLPSQGTVGFEIFDKANPLTMTDFTQQLDYQRGLQGELARTIQQINGVNAAWVAIVLPQSSLYTAAQQDPTASVTVRMNPGSALDPGQVKAMMHLVASSVQGLKPENVTVVDTSGTNLSDAVNAGSLSNGINPSTYGTALDVEHQYEQTLGQQASSMLGTVLGPGKAVIRVNALLNWDQLQQDSTTYQPKDNPIGNQTTNNIATNGSGSTTGGIPGTGSNLVPTPTVTVTTGGSTYTQTQANTVYDVSQTVAHLNKAPGSVQRLTVAVFLDGTYDAATITSIQTAVSNAIGLSNTRGDQITVSALPFNHSTDIAAQNALKAQQQQSQIELIARSIALALAAAALFFFAWRATHRPRPRPMGASVALVNEVSQIVSPDGKLMAEVTTPLQPGEQSLLMTSTNDTASFLAAARQRQMSEVERHRAEEIRKGLIDLTKQHPDLIANVIQGWFDAER
ncbi:MAG: flagellar M-ring protein FliF [Ktedonobacterales bacterium]|nr:flagellar M-ring protein FliF [Ktedonobacterales bacterium]